MVIVQNINFNILGHVKYLPWKKFFFIKIHNFSIIHTLNIGSLVTWVSHASRAKQVPHRTFPFILANILYSSAIKIHLPLKDTLENKTF